MGDVIADLLPLIVGATAAPFYPVAVLLMLRGRGGTAKALAFVGGNVAARLAQGAVFGLVLGAAVAAGSEDGQRLVVSALLLVVGILLLITAAKKWRKEEDPDAPPPRWLAAIGGLSAVGAVGAGAPPGSGRQAVGLHPLRHRRHRRGGTGPGREHRAVPSLRVGHAGARAAPHPGARRGAAPGGRAAEVGGNLAVAA